MSKGMQNANTEPAFGNLRRAQRNFGYIQRVKRSSVVVHLTPSPSPEGEGSLFLMISVLLKDSRVSSLLLEEKG
jgi:hypothetical protein